MDAELIRQLILVAIPDAQVRIAGADGVHFEAEVVSAAFTGKRLLERHRMVYAGLGERMGGEIHALALKTLTPEEQQTVADRPH